jgi:hypothetical protein
MGGDAVWPRPAAANPPVDLAWCAAAYDCRSEPAELRAEEAVSTPSRTAAGRQSADPKIQ